MKHLIFQSRFVILLLGFLTFGISQAWGAAGATHDWTSYSDWGQDKTNWLRNNSATLPTFTYTPSYPITKITLNVKQSNTTGSNKVKVTIDGVQIGDEKTMGSSTSAFDMVFQPSSAVKGEIKIIVTNTSGSGTSKGTFYLNKITLTEGSLTTTTITLSEAGGESQVSGTHYVGEEYTLPSSTEAVCGAKKLAGWSTVEITNPMADKPTSNFYKKGEKVTLAASNKFYAVFADEGGGGTSNETLTCSAGTIANNTMTFNTTNFTFVHAKESSSNFGSYSPWRMYQNTSLTISGDYTITKVEMVTNTTNYGGWTTTAGDVTVATTSGGTSKVENINASSVKFTFTSQARWSSIKVYYDATTYSNYTTTCSSDPLIEGLTITPSEEPTDGLYWEPITATIGCTTTGVTIKYSLDGTEPSIPYTIGTSEPISITATSTLKVKATKSGHQDASKSQSFTFGKVYADVNAYLADKANIADYEKIKINYLRVTITSISNNTTVNFSGASLYTGSSVPTSPISWATNGILVAKNQIYTARVFQGSSYQLRPSSWNVLTYVTNLPNVTGLNATNITSNSVTLEWTAVTNAGSYKVKFNNEEKDATTETSMTISDLNYNTQYSWYVKALTADLDVATDGNYGSAKTVKTLDVPHTVTFHAGDKGTCATESLTETATGVGVILPAVTDIATGYDFIGWSTSETPTSANAGAAGANYKPADDIDLYAYYTPQIYDIAYQDKGGAAFSGSNLGLLPKKHTYNAETQLTDGVKTGYHFDGWFGNPECTGSAMTSVPANNYSTHFTLYAKWAINSYTLTWNLNGGTVTEAGTAAGSVVYATELKAPELEKTGYHYTWSPAVPETMPASDATYSAIWEANVYDITYLDKGGETFTGSWGTHPTQHTYGTATPLVSPTKAHFDFAGWYLKSDCSGEPLENLAADGYLDNITLYAKWNEHDKYTVTFIDDVQGTDCSAWNLNNTYINTQIVFNSIGDKTRKAPTGDCVTDHYHFVGWVEEGTIPTKDPDNVIKVGTTSIKITKNVTYKAVWAKEL